MLTAYKGLEHYQNRYKGDFTEMNSIQLFEELRLFMSHLELDSTIFRSDHASNSLVLKGVLGKDKSAFLAQIDEAIDNPESAELRNTGNGVRF